MATNVTPAPAAPADHSRPCRSAATGAFATKRSSHSAKRRPPVPSATQTTFRYPFGAGSCPAMLRAAPPGSRVRASRPPAA